MAQERVRLLLGPALETRRVDGVDVQGPPPGHRMDHDHGVNVLRVRLGRRGDRHGGEVLDLVEQPTGAVGHAGRVHRAKPVERRPESGRQRLVGQVLVRPDRVAPVVGDVPGVQQRVRRWCGQVAEVAVPRIGEVQDVGGLLDDPDDVGTVLERVHERRHVAPAQQIGHPLEVVEAEVLSGQEHDEVVGERPAQIVELRGLRHRSEVDAGDGGAQRARHRLHGERRAPGRRHGTALGQARPRSSAPLRQKKRSRVDSSKPATASPNASKGRFPPSGWG